MAVAESRQVRIFGIRHHGPGCARSLRAALDAWSPELVLVEGPPEAEEVLDVARSPELVPPVALLLHPPDEPSRATVYPFASFSPEWQALRHGVERGATLRFMDVPAGVDLALDPEPEEEGGAAREDPVGALARAAGYEDRELWWERQVEQRRDALGLFEGILEAMTLLRETAPQPSRREGIREAFMRRAIREAGKDGFRTIAVVCGAWHAPALATLPPAKDDDALLKGLARRKVLATWIPWTHSRLLARSGYGAGIDSPGWYRLLHDAPDDAPLTWVTQCARLLRRHDLDASSASVIDAVRLADALAGVRGLALPGLAELSESVLATLCHGDPLPLRLVRDELEIGEAMGAVPAGLPVPPLQRDLEARQQRLRLKVTTEIRKLDLDLRNETDRERSLLLHRLRLLDVPWGEIARGEVRSTGTFRETWQLQWQPELAIRLLERSLLGSTVESAATARVQGLAADANELPELTTLLDSAVLAGLDAAIEEVLSRVQERSAASADVRHLMEALLPLARIARYGDVRGTPSARMRAIASSLFARATIGLPGACGSLDDEAARGMADSMAGVAEAVALLDAAEERAEWVALLDRMSSNDAVHAHVRGWACRLLLEAGGLADAELGRRAGLELSAAVPAPQAAAWLEGMLRGSGLVLLSRDEPWRCLDAWLASLPDATFDDMLPVLRRAFSGFHAPERARMGDKVKDLRRGGGASARATRDALDEERARRVLPVLALVLGVEARGEDAS